MSPAPRDLITENLELLSLPDIVVRINAMIDDPGCSAVDIAEVIGEDAALTARLLKLVNSPFYNFPSRVDTLSMAITIVGTRQLRDLAMAAAIAGRFRHIPKGLPSADAFWQHNLACATAARILALKGSLNQGEQLFVAGLLHDIGKLVMYLTRPEPSREVLELARQPDAELASLERNVFGFDHGEVGAELLREWQLPESLVSPTRWHHDPRMAEDSDFRRETAVVHLANAIANTVAPPVSPDDDLPIDLGVWPTLGLDPDLLDDLIRETESQLPGITAIIYAAA